MKCTVAELAAKLGADFEGDGAAELVGLAGVRDAERGDLSFVSNPKYAAAVASTKASALIVRRDWSASAPCALIRVEDPDRAFAEAAVWFLPAPVQPQPGIHPSAVVAETALLGEAVHVGPCCVIEPGARIGDRVVLGAGCYVGHDCEIGADTRLYPHVSLRERVRLGARVIVHNGTVIGSDGFGYTVDAKGVRTKIPQVGTVVVGDDVEIGANVAIDRARFGKTRIGRGVKIDNLVQIAHNVVIGDHAVIVGQVGISGSTVIGARAVLAGQAGVSGHLVIGEGAIVGAQAGVTKDVPAGIFVSGYPAAPHDKAMKTLAHLQRLPELKERVAAAEKRLDRLESKTM